VESEAPGTEINSHISPQVRFDKAELKKKRTEDNGHLFSWKFLFKAIRGSK
jgi:hypothetical protein